MSYRIAGIDVHKKMLAVVVADVSREGEWQFERRKFGTMPAELDRLHEWLTALEVKEVVMESTAQYWKPVWARLEREFHLELAQAQSNRGPRGRKSDFADAERLVRRYAADELTLSFVPGPEQRLWRRLSRGKQELAGEKVRLQNRLEALLEEMHIKLSSLVSDLLGVSGRKMLKAVAEGETDAVKLAALADVNLRATPDELRDAFRAAATLDGRYRMVLQQYLDRLALIERHMEELEKELAHSLKEHEGAVTRLAQVPGLGVDSAQQIIAEVGPKAERFPSAGQLSSWVGTCPGKEESAEQSKSNRSPKGNRPMRRILNQAANAAVKSQGTVFEALYKRIKGRDPKQHNKAVWAVANHQSRVIWKILHDGVNYEERGNRTNIRAMKHRARRLARELRQLGYVVQPPPPQRAPA